VVAGHGPHYTALRRYLYGTGMYPVLVFSLAAAASLRHSQNIYCSLPLPHLAYFIRTYCTVLYRLANTVALSHHLFQVLVEQSNSLFHPFLQVVLPYRAALL
jgi:hypothetical protein